MYYLDDDCIVTVEISGITQDGMYEYHLVRVNTDKSEDVLFVGNCYLTRNQDTISFAINDLVETNRFNVNKTDDVRYRSVFDVPIEKSTAIIGAIDDYCIKLYTNTTVFTSDIITVANIYRYPFRKRYLEPDLESTNECENMLQGYNTSGLLYPPHIPYMNNSRLFSYMLNKHKNYSQPIYYYVTDASYATEEYTPIKLPQGENVNYTNVRYDSLFHNVIPTNTSELWIANKSFRQRNIYNDGKNFYYDNSGDFTQTSDNSFVCTVLDSEIISTMYIDYDTTTLSTIDYQDNNKHSAIVDGKISTISGDGLYLDVMTTDDQHYYLYFKLGANYDVKLDSNLTIMFDYQLDNANQTVTITDFIITTDQTYFINKLHLAKVDVCPKDYYVIWQDRYGGIQSQPFNKVLTYTEDVQHKEIVSYRGYRSVGNTVVQPKWKLNTDWIYKKFYPIYESLLTSQYVRLYDVEQDKLYEILVTNNEYTEKTYNNQKQLFNMSIDVELNKNQNMLY